MRAHLSCSIPLPDDFRVGDVLDFHGRDALAVAERIDGHCLQKGLIWEGQVAFLTIHLAIGHADVELAIDGVTNANQDALIQMVRRMLGLTQRIEDFEYIYRNHPQLGLLIVRQPGLRVPLFGNALRSTDLGDYRAADQHWRGGFLAPQVHSDGWREAFRRSSVLSGCRERCKLERNGTVPGGILASQGSDADYVESRGCSKPSAAGDMDDHDAH